MALITMKTDCSIDHPDVSPALSPTSSTVSGLPVQLLQLPWQFLQGPDLPFQPFQPSIQNPLIARLAALAVDRNDADMMRQAIDEGFDRTMARELSQAAGADRILADLDWQDKSMGIQHTLPPPL